MQVCNSATTCAGNEGEFQQGAHLEVAERKKRISNAIEFLRDPRVRLTSLANKVHFLKSKGLSAEEVCEAFGKLGQKHSVGDIKNIMERSPSSVMAEGMGESSHIPTRGYTHTETGYSPQIPTVSQQSSGRLYVPQTPPYPPALPQHREADWRDYVIGIGAALMGGFAAFKAFVLYSPYEIRRKDKVEKIRPKMHKRRHRDVSKQLSSESDAGRRSLLLSPPLLPKPTPTAPQDTKDNTQEEVTRLQTELKETQEALDKEKKSRAEFAVTVGKLRGQVQRQSVKIDKQEATIKNLQEENEKLQNNAATKNAQTGDVSDEGSHIPPAVDDPAEASGQLPPPTVESASSPASVEASSDVLPVLRATEFSPEQ